MYWAHAKEHMKVRIRLDIIVGDVPGLNEFMDKVDEAIKSFPRPPGWKSLFHSIHRYGNWYAEEIRTFCRMALYIWRMYLDAESLILPVW